jgi:hypothetical protein
MRFSKSLMTIMISMFILATSSVKTTASDLEDSNQDRYYTICLLNNYIDQTAQNNIEALEEAKTLRAHSLISHILVGNQISLPQEYPRKPLLLKTLNTSPELVAQVLLGHTFYYFPEDQLQYTPFNLFKEEGLALQPQLPWIAAAVLDLVINDFHIPPLRRTFIAGSIFKEAAEQGAVLPRNNHSLLYVQHVASLNYYYNYMALTIDYLYNPLTHLKNFDAIYSYLEKMAYHATYQKLANPLNVYGLRLPNTLEAVKSFFGRAGLNPQNIQDLLIFKLSRRSRLSQLWALQAFEIEIGENWCLSGWARLVIAALNQSRFMKQITNIVGLTNVQDTRCTVNTLLALPFRERERYFQTIMASYEVDKGTSHIPLLINALLCVPLNQWPELRSYIKPFIFRTTSTFKKVMMVKAFNAIPYKDWPQFFKACLQLVGYIAPLDYPDAIAILTYLPVYNWQQFITYAKEITPQGLDHSRRFKSMIMLSQFSEVEWPDIAATIRRLSPFMDEKGKVKIIEAFAYVQPHNLQEFISFIEKNSIQDPNYILSLSLLFPVK